MHHHDTVHFPLQNMTAGNILYLYLICMNFTKQAAHNENVESTTLAATAAPLGATLSANDYAQLLHDKTVDLLKIGDLTNDFLVLFDGDAQDLNSDVEDTRSRSTRELNPKVSYWRDSERLTPLTNYLMHKPLDSTEHHSYQATDAYVRWFCNKVKLQGNVKKRS